jgi:mevalonate kinase
VEQALTSRIPEQEVAVEATAPGKIILFGEHAINRGQPAVAASVGLRAHCCISLRPTTGCSLRSGINEQTVSRESILALTNEVDRYRKDSDFESIRRLAASDYFAPAKYILGSAFKENLPEGLTVEWKSEIPPSSGLGSGGAAFTAMTTAMERLLPEPATMEQRAMWAHLGDVIAHGGIASALDTQTSLLGGTVQFTGHGLASAVKCASGLALVIGHSGIIASTSEVNTRVRLWLEEKPAARMVYFRAIGALSRAAVPLLETGNWDELGRLMTLNQLVLEKIGVSCAESDRLIEAALAAGALGAKVSGSGGGGIVIALTTADSKQEIARAMQAAGGSILIPEIAVPGATVVSHAQKQ